MSNQPAPLTGPDLSKGVPLASLPDGAPFLGHAEGEPVVLVRRGQTVQALGATCTHYSGPLAEGLVVGDTLRCPWHHACFSLADGTAVAAPALNPVPCYAVERQGDLVRVTGRRPAAPPPPPLPGPPGAVVIIGAGAAGAAAAEQLRREGYAGSLTLVGADPDAPYDRPNLSKDYLAGNAPEDWIPLRPPEFYAEQRITLRLGVRATSVDPAARRVSLADGTVLPYDALLLATGADPVRLPIPGADLPHVHCLRSLADSRAIVAATAGARRAVVLGASFIGLEVAAALRARGLEVAVAAPEPRPLERILGAEAGAFVQALHEEHGVRFYLGRTGKAITREAVELSGGEVLPADLVVLGVGVRPALALAESAGLALDRGVVVNQFLETSAPGILAAGDIARWPDPWSGDKVRIEHWVVAQRMGQTAARNILGRQEPFRMVPFFWSAHYDVTFAYVGHAESWDQAEVSGRLDQRDCTIVYRRQKRPLAVLTLFRDQVSLQAEAAMERGDTGRLEAVLAG
jgi:NADPH-dependent 2,4-dienoyl-CoA reductase/sulfur reductase-like enzyme/nitrite reductase/ring-hydroxylating ferredoxin subunit